MSTTSIKVQYVNQPKSPKGPGNVKTDEGVYYKVWPKAKDGGATLAQFAGGEGKTFDVEYEEEPDKGYGKTFVIRKILSSSESTNGGSKDLREAFAVAAVDRSARIERQAALKVAVQFHAMEVQAGITAPTIDRLFVLTNAIVADIDNVGKVKPESTDESSEPEVQI